MEVLQLWSHPVIGWQDAPPGINAQINFMSEKNKKNDVKESAIILVNHCKTQPVDRLVSYDEIKHIVQFDPRQTREGRAIMRWALKDLLKEGFVFLVKRGYGIYLAKGIHYRISKKDDLWPTHVMRHRSFFLVIHQIIAPIAS
jgi:hypothetical protein